RGQAQLKQFERYRQTAPEIKRLHYLLAGQPDDLRSRRRLVEICVDTGRYREALQQFRLLIAAGAMDAPLFRGMERAALAIGDTRLLDQARAGLRRMTAAGVSQKNAQGAPVSRP